MATDKRAKDSGATAVDVIPIVPDDSNDLPDGPCRAIRCKPISGTSGTLRIQNQDGDVRNTEIVQGEMLLVAAWRVHATGTAAAGLEALY